MVEITEKPEKQEPNRICEQIKAILLNLLICIRYYIDLLIDYIFGLYYNPKRQFIKKPTNPLVLESAQSLSKKIRNRQITCEEVVRAFIERIKQVNTVLNAVVDDRFDEAIAEAQQLDRDIADGSIIDVDFQTKPFLGIPFTSKESTACEGLSNTFGLLRRKHVKAKCDATIVQSMKKAGGILLAVTNIPQLNLWQETSNPLHGTTNNPYDTTRNVGGSSGGEASIIAACGSPLGLGTDIGGSIRIPAYMCGIFGHKPTCDLISTSGLTFRTGNEKNSMVVPGPMTRYVDDLVPLLRVLLGDKQDKLQLDKPVDLKNLHVFYVKNPKDLLISPFRDDMKQTISRVINYFSDILTQKPKELDLNDLKYAGKLWHYWMRHEPDADFCYDIANREEHLSPIGEIVKYLCGRSEFNVAVMCNLIKNLQPQPNGEWVKTTTENLRKKLTDILGTDGVLLYPSAPFAASYHHTAVLRPFNLYLFAVWNVLKFPVTQVPLGLNHEGLPLGIQVVAAPHQDRLCLAVAKELEKAFGGYVPPFETSK